MKRTTQANRLIVFARFPEPGRAKTRLIPALGAHGAAELHREMVAHTLMQAGRLNDVEVEVRFCGGAGATMAALFGTQYRYTEQGPGDLGERMCRAIEAAFAEGASRVVLIGADCPGLTTSIIAGAFDAIENADLVIGPALDGGYYLIGMSRPIDDLFRNIQWGADSVLRSTLQIAERLQIAPSILQPLADVDRPEDLAQVRVAMKRVQDAP